jgi:ABC-type multidrug transport system fused ATPase/permease subunit
MALEAPISKYKKTNFKIYIVACIVFAIVFAYDGYLSKYQWSHRSSFYEKHVKEGQPDDTMIFNQIAPIFLFLLAAVLTGRLQTLKGKKLLAAENELVISDKEKISYDSIQKIDKTSFDSKGFFIITYKNKDSREVNRKISDRAYDNLAAVLDKLVAKIS